ncbi:TetR/AcrR family transcriptional regulator C-terminal domain-containing protein [Pseudarthrobacter sp. R1]|uniref:TetR/AcrR family transcriptional regulator n=1 Tax=Pseudarthrobacter sp. R1 TaxID=2944934 RepID=UPI002109302D|nr:TetR/AcrR family transcriptional regulator C-terminal domain-containing protein [Pseudarthrobacter sp. R1]MCQ6271449.1 TetR/AcrR family transcriptional regulator C-terminal domain-containing protein [Pseudarthrobacter sp. R1]
MTSVESVKPRRGRPRRIDRERIIEAAKVLDPETLTMQALAEEMGVDRKTLHYHVDNRESLLKMVAADAFREAVGSHHFIPEKDWRKAIRSFAHITRDAVMAAGAWASFVGYETEEDLEALRPAEAAAEALVAAGLSEADAGRVIAMLAGLAFTSATDRSIPKPTGRHPQEPVLEHLLEKAPTEEFTLLRKLVGGRSSELGTEEQFAFNLEIVSLGIERMLETKQS